MRHKPRVSFIPDIERGFIRAEVMKYQDLIKLGSEQKIREMGKYMQKTRDYIIEDGDIVNFCLMVEAF